MSNFLGTFCTPKPYPEYKRNFGRSPIVTKSSKIFGCHATKGPLFWRLSVLERIWIKGSYLSQWLPQGEMGPHKESKSWWIEILHGGSQFTIFFCFTIHKKLNKSCSLKFFFVPEKKILSLKKTLKKKLLVGPTVEDFNASWFWLLRGSPFTLW